jgi:hypothetical protein
MIKGDVMANVLLWLPYLTKQELEQIAFAADCHPRAVPLLTRKRAIEALFEAGRLFSKDYYPDYATLARKLQGLPCAPPVDPPD